MKKINQNISANIQKHMSALNMNQLELAALLGCSNSTVSMWIVGEATPRMDKIDKMCEVFGCSRDDLVGESKKDPVREMFLRRFDRLDDSQRLRLMAFIDNLEQEVKK